jgi:uncharacterized membrane protein
MTPSKIGTCLMVSGCACSFVAMFVGAITGYALELLFVALALIWAGTMVRYRKKKP